MKNLAKLFKLIQMTRSQPQYGYALRQISQSELSNLAEHHYLVTFIAWQVAKELKKKGAKLDLEKILEICLMHDVGELFGGDIAMPYAMANPGARRHAKAFERENFRFINQAYLNEPQKDFEALLEEITDPRTDEGLIAKIADRLEVSHYLFYKRQVPKKFIQMMGKDLERISGKMKDPVSKREIKKFIPLWLKDLRSGDIMDDLNYI